MAPLGSDPDSARGAPWVLPNWEEYSEAASSSIVDTWSDVEADGSLDTASSVASTAHQRVYRIQRARGGFLDATPRSLNDLHSVYTQRRREATSSADSVPRGSPRAPETKRQASLAPQTLEHELLVQQSEMTAELHVVRKQLDDFQAQWHQTREANGRTAARETERPHVSTGHRSWPSPARVEQERVDTSVQTESDDGVTQWLTLLTREVEAFARRYAHEATQPCPSAMVHLATLRRPSQGIEGGEETPFEALGNDTKPPTVASWHVGHKLQDAVAASVAAHFVALEEAIATVAAAVDEHERRCRTNYEGLIQQVQGYHQERLQCVVNETLAEVKVVRGRYRKKEVQLEEELRMAKKEVAQGKERVAEAEHKQKLEREVVDVQLAAAKDQHHHICKRYEEELVQLKKQLEVVQTERKVVVSQHRDTHEVIAQAKEGAIALERQCQALKKQQERTKELHEREVRVLQGTICQLEKNKHEMEIGFAKDRDSLLETIENLKALKEKEMHDLKVRVRSDVEQQMIRHTLPEKLEGLRKEHEEAMCAMTLEHKRQLALQADEVDKKKHAELSSVFTIETQTDFPSVETKSVQVETEAQVEVEKLRRRCQALEKLLDRKFQEMPLSRSRHQCKSYHSDDGVPTRNESQDRSSIQSDCSFHSMVSGKSRARARAVLGSSRVSLRSHSSETKVPSLSMNETTLVTEDATLSAHEMWDSASFTSIDTADDGSTFTSQHTTPRHQMRRTREMLSLVRQLKQAEVFSFEGREPDPEANWVTPHQKPKGLSSKFKANEVPGPSASIFDDLL